MQTRIVKHLTKKMAREIGEKNRSQRNKNKKKKKNLSETRTYEMLLDESKKKWWYCIHFIEEFNKLSNDYLKNRIACVVFFDEIFFCTCVSALSLKLNKQIDEKQNERKGKKNHTLSQKYTKQTHTHTHTHAHSLKFQFELFGMGMARTKLNEMLMINWALIISFRRFFLFLFRLVVYFFSPVKSPTPPNSKVQRSSATYKIQNIKYVTFHFGFPSMSPYQRY